MDQQQQNVNQAAQEWAEAVRQSFQSLADQTVTLQESNLKLTQNFFRQSVEQLLQSGQALQQQSQRQQQAFEALAEESANAYSDFLNSALSFYQQTMSQATQAAQSNLRMADQVARQSVQTAEGVAEQVVQNGAETSERAALIAHHVAYGSIASAAGWESGGPDPIGDPAARTDDEQTPSRYAAPDHAAAMRLIDELLSEDSSYDEETWPEIAEALDRDRPSRRKLFID